jgi:predicted Zn finger-like uncharacterized protein
MIVICEECGKKYRIDPARIKGAAASFKCRECAHLIMVSKIAPPAPQSVTESSSPIEAITATGEDTVAGAVAETGDLRRLTSKGSPETPRKAGGLGLQIKMILLFLVIPMILMACASLLYLWQLETMSNLITQESSIFVNQMAEEKIADLSAAVATQCMLYLLNHPELKKEEFNEDIGFKTLAVQKVGRTGYTALYELPDADGVWRTWAHMNPKIVAIDMNTLQIPLGKNFPGFWKIFSGVRGGKKSQGYYTWQERDGSFRDKFMVCSPISGTPFVIAATTYLNEFTGPIKKAQSRANALTQRAGLITWSILGATLLLSGAIVSIFGHRLTGKIKSLTKVADRISKGDLGVEVEKESSDEIGELAEAVARMQESIRISVERSPRKKTTTPA